MHNKKHLEKTIASNAPKTPPDPILYLSSPVVGLRNLVDAVNRLLTHPEISRCLVSRYI